MGRGTWIMNFIAGRHHVGEIGRGDVNSRENRGMSTRVLVRNDTFMQTSLYKAARVGKKYIKVYGGQLCAKLCLQRCRSRAMFGCRPKHTDFVTSKMSLGVASAISPPFVSILGMQHDMISGLCMRSTILSKSSSWRVDEADDSLPPLTRYPPRHSMEMTSRVVTAFFSWL